MKMKSQHLHRVQRVIQSDVEQHPAVVGLSRFAAGMPTPTSVEVLKETRGGRGQLIHGVYRLNVPFDGCGSVIAKHCRTEMASKERLIYEELLECLPVSSLRCYGIQEQGDGEHAWLFLEDAGASPFLKHDPQYQVLQGTWLGTFHVHASKPARTFELKDSGPDGLRERLTSAMTSIEAYLEGEQSNRVDPTLLRDLLTLFTWLKSDWPDTEFVCREVPYTVVHGDFIPKNLCVRKDAVGLTLLPFDWQTAGWGPPAADLAQAFWLRPRDEFLTSYLAAVEEHWPNVTFETLMRLARVGTLFRTIDAVRWDVSWIDEWEADRLTWRLRSYRDRLQRFQSSKEETASIPSGHRS